MTEQESAHPINSVPHQSQMITNHTVESMPERDDNEKTVEDDVFSDRTDVDLEMTKSKSMVR